MELPCTILRPPATRLALDSGEVMRILGYKPGVTRLEPAMERLVAEGIARAVAAAEPAASLAYSEVVVEWVGARGRADGAAEGGARGGADGAAGVGARGRADGAAEGGARGGVVSACQSGLTWRSNSLARFLRDAAGVTLVAVTLGPGVERETERLFQSEEYALATVVDAAGSVLVHSLGEHVRHYLADQLQGFDLTPLYGPGYGDWPVEDQAALTAAAGGPAIGLTCTEACYLRPQKSLVGIAGWLKPGNTGPAGCALCTMPDCAYRVRPAGMRQ